MRATAAFSLGILDGAIGPDAVAALTEALADPEPRVRGRAAEALARKQGESAAESIGAALAEWVPRGAEPYEWKDAIAVSSVMLPQPDVRGGLFALGALGTSKR